MGENLVGGDRGDHFMGENLVMLTVLLGDGVML